MKTIFTVNISTDGLMNAAFTNIKAIHTFLTKEFGYEINYNSLVKQIRENQEKKRFSVANIKIDEWVSIEICELGILSK